MKIKAIICAVIAATIVFVGGCGKKNEDSYDETVVTVDDIENENEAETEADDEQEDTESEQKKPEHINPLTGEETTKELADNRPVAIMINNIHLAMPQMAISKADIVYEVLEEGGITRLMALYQDYASLPETGSIRSSRDYYIDLSDAHDAIYVHCGGSTYATATLAQRKTNNIDGMYMGNFYRSAERRKTMASEHTLMITGEGLVKNIEQKGYRTESSAKQPLAFYDFETEFEGRSAKSIKVPFSLALDNDPYALSTFEYDQTSGKYLKSQYGKAHIDGGTGEQLVFENVITLECKQYQIRGDALGCIAVEFFGTGEGKYAANGVMKNIVWKKQSRTSSYTLYEEDGTTPLLINPGKSYIAVVPSGTTISAE